MFFSIEIFTILVCQPPQNLSTTQVEVNYNQSRKRINKAFMESEIASLSKQM